MKQTKPKPPKHTLIRTTIEPGKPDVFLALCGYTSTNAKEFTIFGKKTCAVCIVKTRGK